MLAGGHFAGAVFRKAALDRAIAERGDFAGADFREARMHLADLGRAALTGANFTGANLREVTLEGANADKAIFVHADLTRVRASERAHFVQASFQHAKAPYGNFDAAVCDRADFA